jgi:hypothetical protein
MTPEDIVRWAHSNNIVMNHDQRAALAALLDERAFTTTDEWPCVVVEGDGSVRLIGSALLRPGRYRLLREGS